MDNLLSNFIISLEQLPLEFRNSVCEKFDWSYPTFYTKLRRIRNLSHFSDREINFMLDEANRLLENILNLYIKIPVVYHIKVKTPKLLTDNKLQELYTNMAKLSVVYKEQILKECNWSETKFIRKKSTAELCVSNIERNGIIALFNNVLCSALAQAEYARKELYRNSEGCDSLILNLSF